MFIHLLFWNLEVTWEVDTGMKGELLSLLSLPSRCGVDKYGCPFLPSSPQWEFWYTPDEGHVVAMIISTNKISLAEAPIHWPSDVKSQLSRKDPDARKDRRQEKKGTTEMEMAGWHHWLGGHESEQPLGVGEGQGSLACGSPWHCKESNTAEWLNNK